MEHPYGYIKDNKVYLKGFLGQDDRVIGEVKEDEASTLNYFEARFEQLKEKVEKLKSDISENQNKGSFLMKLIADQIDKGYAELHQKNIKVRFIGDRSRIKQNILSKIEDAENTTKNNTGLFLNIAIDYSGTYDIVQAVNKIIQAKRRR